MSSGRLKVGSEADPEKTLSGYIFVLLFTPARLSVMSSYLSLLIMKISSETFLTDPILPQEIQ